MPDLATLIMNQARKTGADPYTLLATAMVESGLNPNAVGDGGSSYGLFQMHVGGAGGSSHDSARRYLDPSVAVENRARAFRGGSGGAFAASVQRPADQAGYARKVDAVIAQLKAGKMPKGSNVQLNAPVVSGGSTGGSTGSSSKAAALSFVFGDDPIFALAAQSAGSAAPAGPSVKTGAGVPARRAGETGQQYLDRIAMSKFGLKHDASNSQTTGGRHTDNSYHYRGQATDFGDAANSRASLNAWKRYVDANKDALGIAESLDEGNHIHTATLKSRKLGKFSVSTGGM